MLYYRSCIGLWCCRAPPLSGALCKEISVAGDANAIARFEPLCKGISVIYDGKSVARSVVLCKGISVTCNGKTQRLFWAFRNSCVTDFHFRSDKKIRVWRWVAPARSRESTHSPCIYPPMPIYLRFCSHIKKELLGGISAQGAMGATGAREGDSPTHHARAAKHTRPLMTQP